MNKKELIRKIIAPVLEEKGFCLKQSIRGIWEWEKEMNGVLENVMITDVRGRISLTIGKDKGAVRAGRAENLIYTIDNPRTNIWDWTYGGTYTGGDSKEELYESILLDYRDILIKNCDEVLKKNVEELQNVVPNKKHFQYMCDNHVQLAEEYKEKLQVNEKDVREILEIIFERIIALSGTTLDKVENELVAYAALLEEEILKQYGGIRKIDYEAESIIVTNVGKYKKSSNVLLTIFALWEDVRRINVVRSNMENLLQREL